MKIRDDVWTGFLLAALSLVTALYLSGCISILKSVDDSSLRDINKDLLADTDTGSPESLTAFLSTFDPFGVPVPDQKLILREPLGRWDLGGESRRDLKQERLSFPSPLGDRVVFYLYYEGELAGKKAVLWVPGYGVSDFAFNFIKKLFLAELDRGYAILFYTLPYHVERKTANGEGSGKIFSADAAKTLGTFAAVVAELRVGTGFLRSEGVESISGWGGSVGAVFLWMLSGREEFDHLALMIPVVDWDTFLFNPLLSPAVDRLTSLGFSRDLLSRGYSSFSPAGVPTLTNPDRIQVLYARHDRLTPEETTLDFARQNGIIRVAGFEESHASILLNRRMYREYEAFLEEMTAGK
jgi:hypothetical protein